MEGAEQLLGDLDGGLVKPLLDAAQLGRRVALVDPNPLVAGQGIRALKEAGLEVEVGLHEAAARALNEAHVITSTLQRPCVTLKAAVTLDGRTATRTRASKWITGPVARGDTETLALHLAALGTDT